MGQYRFALNFKWIIGIGILYNPKESASIFIPFLEIFFGLDKSANGYKIFNRRT